MKIGSFGSIVFEVIKSPESITQELEQSYAEHEVAGGKGLLEWTGEKLSRITMKIRFQAVSIGNFTCDPEEELSKIEELFQKREPQPLFIGSHALGKFVIERLRKTIKKVNAKGDVVLAEVELTLKECGA